MAHKCVFGRVGVVLAGQNSIAAGILNVVGGLFAYLKRNEIEGRSAELFGYIGGPFGFLEGRYRRISKWTQIRTWLNQGGCAAFSYSRSPTRSESVELLEQTRQCLAEHGLNHFVIIGGPRDLFWADFLAEELPELNVIFVPKSKNASQLYVPKWGGG